MKYIWLLLIAVVTIALGGAVFVGDRAEAAMPVKDTKAAKVSATDTTSCKTCHADFLSLIPLAHPAVKGNDLTPCMVCHQPNLPGMEKKNAFATRIHLGHLPPEGEEDCLACHSWSAGKDFGLIGMKESWGAPSQEEMDLLKEIFSSWAACGYMDNLHANASISCGNCHGKELPTFDATVENKQCLKCHGSLDQLEKKTEPVDFKDRNPHKSHLGEINCTVCHKAHSESKAYCLECHQQFKMTIKGAGNPKK